MPRPHLYLLVTLAIAFGLSRISDRIDPYYLDVLIGVGINVILAVSRLFWRERKEEKARSWCNRAVTLDPDLGDAWANYFAFESQHGTPEQQTEVLRRAVAADPHHGDEWTAVSKSPRNLRCSTDELVKRVAENMALNKYEMEALEKIG